MNGDGCRGDGDGDGGDDLLLDPADGRADPVAGGDLLGSLAAWRRLFGWTQALIRPVTSTRAIRAAVGSSGS